MDFQFITFGEYFIIAYDERKDVVMKFQIHVRMTSIIITPGEEALEALDPLINLLSYEDEFEEAIHTLGFMYDESNDRIFLHRGVDLNYLKRLLPNSEIFYDSPDVYEEMSFKYEEIYAPRDDEQVDVINFVSGMNEHSSNNNKEQIFLVLGTGKGKTFCSSVGACLFGLKTLIIMHRDNLRDQWVTSLKNMIGMDGHDFHEIDTTAEFEAIAKGTYTPDYSVYLMTHATFRAGLKRVGDINLAMNFAKNLKIGMKIIDEAHLEFRDTILIDFLFNIKRNLYLTATDGRSSKDENSIFKMVFSNCEYYHRKLNVDNNNSRPNKWVEYTSVTINTHVPIAVDKYRIEGGRGMNPASYGKWCIQRDKKQTHIKCVTEIIRMIYENDPNAKVLVFMPLIDLCDDTAYYIRKTLNNDPNFNYDLNVKTINSHNTKQENERNKRADVIVTTIGSCGTGTDIPGMTDIICCSPFKSSITVKQVLGRLRYCGKTCHYYDICDASVKMDGIFMKLRKKTFQHLVLKMSSLSWEEDTSSEEEK